MINRIIQTAWCLNILVALLATPAWLGLQQQCWRCRSNKPNGACPGHLAKGHQPSWQHHERSPACWGQPMHGIHIMGFNGYTAYPQLYRGNTEPQSLSESSTEQHCTAGQELTVLRGVTKVTPQTGTEHNTAQWWASFKSCLNVFSRRLSLHSLEDIPADRHQLGGQAISFWVRVSFKTPHHGTTNTVEHTLQDGTQASSEFKRQP